MERGLYVRHYFDCEIYYNLLVHTIYLLHVELRKVMDINCPTYLKLYSHNQVYQ